MTQVTADAAEWIATGVGCTARTRSCAPIRAIWWHGRPVPSTRSAASSGATPNGWGPEPHRMHQELPIRLVEEPREPHRTSVGGDGVGRPSGQVVVPRLLALRADPSRVPAPRHRRRRCAGRLVQLGLVLPDRTVRRVLPPHQETPDSIVDTLTHGLSIASIESINTKPLHLIRVAFRCRSTDNLIALCLLDRGGCCRQLPGWHATA
jgi:hypothetical protein